ncbi:hypothetical protein [Paraburkholderia sp. CNPSo 3076]|uniref:hypothetical protein n=1 Tax=Paraburkholderia sp. CNPSo 3076 TaxID=2940936 RepID=UPI003A523564
MRAQAIGMAAWTVRVIALVAALSEVGIATASVLAAPGAAGLAIGLALHRGHAREALATAGLAVTGNARMTGDHAALTRS